MAGLCLGTERVGTARLRRKPKPIWICYAHENPGERVQRTVREEFWGGIGSGSLEGWERRLQGYIRFYNRRRQHCAPGYVTPIQYALQRLPRPTRVSHMS